MLPPELPLNSEDRLYDTRTGHSRRIPETLINLEESADYGCGALPAGIADLSSPQQADGGT